MSLPSPRRSIYDLTIEAHMEDMRDGDWVVMRDVADAGGGDGRPTWADRFLTLNDHEDEARPRLEWKAPSSAKKVGAAPAEGASRLLLNRVTEVAVGLPEDVSAFPLFEDKPSLPPPPPKPTAPLFLPSCSLPILSLSLNLSLNIVQYLY